MPWQIDFLCDSGSMSRAHTLFNLLMRFALAVFGVGIRRVGDDIIIIIPTKNQK